MWIFYRTVVKYVCEKSKDCEGGRESFEMAESLFERVWNAIPLFFPLLMENRDEK